MLTKDQTEKLYEVIFGYVQSAKELEHVAYNSNSEFINMCAKQNEMFNYIDNVLLNKEMK